MKIVNHPYLTGVLCREDGAIWLPASGKNKAHWTFGSPTSRGYLQVAIVQKHYYVHRLICEAFHGLCPSDKPEVDHFPDRTPSNNAASNLRWADRILNCRNKKVCVKGMEDAVSQTVDKNAYMRTYYANSPEHREKVSEYNRAYYASKRA